ncbi:hypothetical protein ACFWY6_32440 [Streptomyces sp. NPDC059037]|uniref:hypothetical protein n=1 Tax=Streptomyces sp. NPDC059037 TaxID=3346710 RepID=UPI0036A27AC0
MTTSRAMWFAVTFVFAAPSMSAVFRENGRFTRRAMALGIVFAASIAMIMAVSVGQGAS